MPPAGSEVARLSRICLPLGQRGLLAAFVLVRYASAAGGRKPCGLGEAAKDTR